MFGGEQILVWSQRADMLMNNRKCYSIMLKMLADETLVVSGWTCAAVSSGAQSRGGERFADHSIGTTVQPGSHRKRKR